MRCFAGRLFRPAGAPPTAIDQLLDAGLINHPSVVAHFDGVTAKVHGGIGDVGLTLSAFSSSSAQQVQ
jgi:hypothetical protein